MSESEPSIEELDRDTITDGELANWLNRYGPDWVLEIDPIDRETEYLGFVDGRFKLAHEGGIDFVSLDYLGDVVDRMQSIDHLPVEESPFATDEDDGDTDVDADADE